MGFKISEARRRKLRVRNFVRRAQHQMRGALSSTLNLHEWKGEVGRKESYTGDDDIADLEAGDRLRIERKWLNKARVK